MSKFFIGAWILVLIGCVKHRDLEPKFKPIPEPVPDTIGWGRIRINEFISSGTNPEAANKFGSIADWVEVYNPGDSLINFGSGDWFVTDDLTNPSKHRITATPNQIIPPKGFLAFICTSDPTQNSPTRINANFGLSSNGESIGIFYRKPGTNQMLAIDTLSYSPPIGAQNGVSYGRRPDGIGNIITLPRVSPEASNN